VPDVACRDLDGLHEILHTCSVSLLVNGQNAVTIGRNNGECWVQSVVAGASMPPKVVEGRWMLLPPQQFSEDKKLRQLVKMLPSDLSQAWDNGNGLHIPTDELISGAILICQMCGSSLAMMALLRFASFCDTDIFF